MDEYQFTYELLLDFSIVKDWPALRSIVQKAVSGHPRVWRFPIIACTAVGGDSRAALAGVAAIACLHSAILLVDDMLDEDPRGQYHTYGKPATANMAATLQAMGFEAIFRSQANPEIKLAIHHSLHQMTYTTTYGQYLDCSKIEDEATFWKMVRTKSSPFFGVALFIGALLGGAPFETAYQVESFGQLYGEILQIHDDLNDCMAIPANPDWYLGRSPLPILFAQLVRHPDRERFIELRQIITDEAALKEAQSILIRCGAISYAVEALIKKHKVAEELLAGIHLTNRDELEQLLEALIEPVKRLSVRIGVDYPRF